jgi:hypothetical protein
MIARMWHGMVPVSKADKYLDLMRRVALPDYLATRGNRGDKWGPQVKKGAAHVTGEGSVGD